MLLDDMFFEENTVADYAVDVGWATAMINQHEHGDEQPRISYRNELQEYEVENSQIMVGQD